ncbi:response regulator transcription factor [Paenibacillus tuaregi]|uniref:response regulator transcription factor n=1 Tax=Paenibacillus tuaregi TaxID=1816681 RepID=UPI000839773E|nr:response regulator transcription factor [Paenibacillus tuaregi]
MEEIRILIADDEPEIRNLLRTYLEREQYRVDTAAGGSEALQLFAIHTYQLIVLDLMMPGVDGIEVCRRVREQSNVPIVMLTAKDLELDKVLGLSMGADDYITKPFSTQEVVARIKAQLRRYVVLGGSSGTDGSQQPERSRLSFANIVIDLKKYTVTKAGEPISLTAKEFELLKFFATHPEQVFTKTQLFRQVWSHDYIEDDNTVMVHIRRLRKKIEEDPSNPKYIQTVWGIGYRFMGDEA